ncbi:MAG: hypothetical protein H6624_15565 [Bdellovibrionaceae bacterium]|nr:hypothetical protein [Pseudobdellovibrionaceae bacterium]
MNKTTLWSVTLLVCSFVVFLILPDSALAQVGGIGAGDLANRVSGLTNKIITVILPAVSILGLVYAAIMAAAGDQSAKPRMILIIIASVVGFLAPLVIHWFQGATGSGGF